MREFIENLKNIIEKNYNNALMKLEPEDYESSSKLKTPVFYFDIINSQINFEEQALKKNEVDILEEIKLSLRKPFDPKKETFIDEYFKIKKLQKDIIMLNLDQKSKIGFAIKSCTIQKNNNEKFKDEILFDIDISVIQTESISFPKENEHFDEFGDVKK